ncbi:MAG: DUF4301 family protein [Bacteroidales bacterium]|nr:DUF4301 family protein [Bacteroidales bacterium]
MKFTNDDIKILNEKGITVEKVESQLENFRKGFPYIKLVRAATQGNGIKILTPGELNTYIKKYDAETSLVKQKFIPASGAATRMFKALFEFEAAFRMSGYDPAILSNEAYRHVKEFFENISNFAFYPALKELLAKSGNQISKLIENKEYNEILDALLGETGMNYRNLPKALILFHLYPDGPRTAVEEHLAEGAEYAKNSNGIVSIHLTVSPEHINALKELVKKVKVKFEQKHNVKYDVTYSVQKTSTDTIAVDKDNNAFRDNAGNLVFRPAGHGALIENLSDLDADIVFIKNIDNITPDSLRPDTVLYKKALAGVLLDYREKIFRYINLIEKRQVSPSILKEIGDFFDKDLCIHLPDKKMNDAQLLEFYKEKLNRPLRVCGMVKNSGEPGGGPFWAENPDGSVSLQIVETTQIDMKNMFQRTTLESSTHFNPVDIICTFKDYRNNKFDLHNLVDPSAGFITKKSKDGVPLKAQELPGLWNGSMSGWNTIFYEVPASTFSPVKTINDLIRPEHQP